MQSTSTCAAAIYVAAIAIIVSIANLSPAHATTPSGQLLLEASALGTTRSNIPETAQTSSAFGGIGINTDFGNFTNLSYGQSFLAHRTGPLQSIAALIAAGPTVNQAPDLRATIFSATDGVPSTALGGISVAGDTLMDRFSAERDHRVTLDFADLGIQLERGLEYMVVYDTPLAIDGDNEADAPYFVAILIDPASRIGVNYSQRSDGTNWTVLERLDGVPTELASSITIIPEPASVLIVMLAFCLLEPATRRKMRTVVAGGG